MRFADRHKGSISVFLTLIILPVFIFSCVIIDGTRIYSSASIMSSAGDLTMNAALSDFDTIVKDVYGLMAMSDTPEEMSDNLESYLTDMLEQAIGTDISSDSITANYISSICKLLQDYDEDTTFDNIVNIQIEGFEAISVADSSLANPEVLEYQIVEYMKYRGPVAITTGLISKFTQLKDVDAQTDAVEAKTTYEKKLASLGDALGSAYEYLHSYLNLCDSLNMNEASTYQTDINGVLKQVNKVFYYMTAATSDDVTKPLSWDMDDDETIEAAYTLIRDNYDRIMTYDDAEDVEDVILSAILEGDSAADLYDYDENTKTQLLAFFSQIIQVLENSGYFEDQFIDFTSTGTLDTSDLSRINFNLQCIASNVDDAETILNYVLEIQGCLADDDTQDRLSCALALCRVYDYYVAMGYDNGDDILSWSSDTFEDIIETIRDSIDQLDNMERLEGWMNLSSNLESAAKSTLSTIRTNSLYYQVINAKWYLSAAKLWLEKSKTKVSEVDAARDDWSDTVDGLSDSETKTSMAAQVTNAESTVTTEMVDTLISLIDSEIEYIDQVSAVYQSMKFKFGDSEYSLFDSESKLNKGKSTGSEEEYYGWFLSSDTLIDACDSTAPEEIKTFNDQNIPSMSSTIKDSIVNAYESSIGTGGVSLDEDSNGYESYSKELIEYYAEQKCSEYFTPNASYQFSVSSSSKYSSILEDELYVYLKKCYDTTNKPSTEGTDTDSDLKTRISSTSSATETSTTGYSPNSISTSDIENILSAIASANSASANLATIGSTSIKEGSSSKTGEKYSSTADSAFSVISSAKSLLSKLSSLIEAERDILYVGTYASEMFTCATTNIDDGKAITTASKMETSLSGYTFSAYNNYCYQQELEYILWGNSDLDKNIDDTKLLIYALRFALNTIYAFSASDIQSMTNAAASLISCGVAFIQPIVNAVLTLVVAAAESALDLADLMDGKDVVIYKSTDTWRVSGLGVVRTVTTTATERVIENVFSAIENVSDDAIDGLVQVGNDYVDSTVDSVAETINSTVITPITNKLTEYASTVDNFGTTEEQKVEEIVTNSIEAMKNSITDDSLIAQAELAALDYLETEGVTYIKQKINEYVSEKSSLSANDAVTKLKDKIDEITKETKSKITTLVSAKLDSASTKLKNKISEACESGADSAKETATTAINDYISEVAGTSAADTASDTATSLVSDTNSSNSIANTLTLNYKEYLSAFIFIALQDEDNRNTMLNRMAVLIQLNISKTASGATSASDQKNISKNSDFTVSTAYTMLVVTADYKVSTIFFNSLTTGDLSLSDFGNTDGLTRTYTSIMGY